MNFGHKTGAFRRDAHIDSGICYRVKQQGQNHVQYTNGGHGRLAGA